MQVFTTLVLTQDPLILMGNAVQGTLNSVLLWQTVSTAIERSRRSRGSAGSTHDSAEEVSQYECLRWKISPGSNDGASEGLKGVEDIFRSPVLLGCESCVDSTKE